MDLNFDHTEYWVQIHGLPLDFRDKENIKNVSIKLGQVQEVDIPLVMGKISGSYPRVHVDINLIKPFPLGVWILNDESKSWIHFCYKK